MIFQGTKDKTWEATAELSKAYNGLILNQMENFISDQIGKNLDMSKKKKVAQFKHMSRGN